MRHVIISAFVNLTAGTKLYRPGSDEPHVLGMRERVTPPGKFESHDEEQVARLIRARCLKASDTAVNRVPGAVGPETDNSVSPPVSGEAVSHGFQNPDAPSPIPETEGRDPRVEGGPSDPAGGSSAAHTGPGPIAGAGAGIAVGDGESPPAGTGVSPPATDNAVSPPVTGIAAIAPPAPAPAPASTRKAGAGSAAVARPNGGGSGDGTVSNRERRRLAREGAKKAT